MNVVNNIDLEKVHFDLVILIVTLTFHTRSVSVGLLYRVVQLK